jgi:regulator of sirC expression with transglutaminase-like and TPR domain
VNKRRITLNLDEDVIDALESVSGRSVSAAANGALRAALARDAHRAALNRWLDELDARHGAASATEKAAAEALAEQLDLEPSSPGAL